MPHTTVDRAITGTLWRGGPSAFGGEELVSEVLSKPRAHLGHLGNRDGQTVALPGVLCKEVLVVVLGIIKRAERLNRGHDSPAPRLLGAFTGRFERLSLLIINKEHGAAILRADVIALAIELARIVHREKSIENDVGRNDGLIKINTNNLGVTGLPGADLFVCGVIYVATAVAGNHVRDAVENSIRRVEAPKAPTAKDKRHHDALKSTRIECQNVVMDPLKTFANWLTDNANLGMVVAVGIVVGSLIIAIVVGATLSSIARRRRKDAIENELNSLAPAVMNVGIDASLYASLSPEAKQLADRAAIGIDMRVRLLNRDGAAEAADWLSGRFTALRNASSLERGDTGRILDQIREAFLSWAYEPKDGIRAFRRDDLEHQRNR
jgi:hypothetical protein